MSALRDYQEVTVNVDGERFAAIVVASAGHHVWLEPCAVGASTAAGTKLAEVSYKDGSRTVLLRGDVTPHEGGSLEFRGHHLARLRDNRDYPRVGLAACATVAWDGADAVTTMTIDVGRGGMLLDAADLAPAGTIVTVSASLPDGELRLDGCVAWTSESGTALKFIGLPEDTGRRLENMVLTGRRHAIRAARDLAA